jgi:hypothetical protein
MAVVLDSRFIRNQNENGRIDFSVTGRDAPAGAEGHAYGARLYGTGGFHFSVGVSTSRDGISITA